MGAFGFERSRTDFGQDELQKAGGGEATFCKASQSGAWFPGKRGSFGAQSRKEKEKKKECDAPCVWGAKTKDEKEGDKKDNQSLA